MSSHLPDGWIATDIGELGGNTRTTVQTGPFGAQLHADDYVNEGVPFILIRNIGPNGLSDSPMPRIKHEDAERLALYALESGDIVFSRVGRVGSCFLAKPEHAGWIISGQTLRIRIPRESVNHDFLYYALRTEEVSRYLAGSSVGSTRSSINTEILESLPIWLPPLREQRKIAAILASVDRCLELTEAMIAKLQDLKKALMQELLTKGLPAEIATNYGIKKSGRFKESPLGMIPEEWEVLRIENCCRVRRGASPRPIGDPRYFGGDVGWVRIADVTAASKYLKKTTDYLSPLGQSKSVRVYPGDLIMSICGTIGKPVILAMDACIHDGFVQFTQIHNLDKEYLYYVLQIIENKLLSYGQPGTQVNINTSIVGAQEIALPSGAEQCEIAKILSRSDIQISTQGTKLLKLHALKKALMHDLLTGKVRVKVGDVA